MFNEIISKLHETLNAAHEKHKVLVQKERIADERIKQADEKEKSLNERHASLQKKEFDIAQIGNLIDFKNRTNAEYEKLQKERVEFQDAQQKFNIWREGETDRIRIQNEANQKEAVRLKEKEKTLESDVHARVTAVLDNIKKG